MGTTKLHPPIVDTQSPAQYDLANISIPFRMNKSVGGADFDQISIRIKTTSSSVILGTGTTSAIYDAENNIYKAIFNANGLSDKLQPGQYYKAQLAYVGKDSTVGFYSTATTFKMTNQPQVLIKNLNQDEINIHFYNYIGEYNNIDSTEKVYSYKFNLYDNMNNLVASSGEKIHNSTLDTSKIQSIDTWMTRHSLREEKYTIEYVVKTINGIEVASPKYTIVDNQSSELDLSQYWNLFAENNFDSGCINLYLQSKNQWNKVERASGQFVLVRAASDENYDYWHEITRFDLLAQDTTKPVLIYKDYCVAQGVVYKYAIQSYNSQNVYSKRLNTDFITADFEDIFLSDQNHQLRIRFNPKVSSFKNTILESKVDTIGGKYPFFFRNGNLNYKEFPISGLITMNMDEYQEFIKGIFPPQSYRNKTPSDEVFTMDLSTSLSSGNFKKEREFKEAVLNWLTNGKPKQFRSPGEGNYIIRLMNTSLSPHDQLSRMIHTFNSTAYEIDEYNFTNLQKYNLLFNTVKDIKYLKFAKANADNVNEDNEIELHNIIAAKVIADPGTVINYKDDIDNILKTITVDLSGEYSFIQDNASTITILPNENIDTNAITYATTLNEVNQCLTTLNNRECKEKDEVIEGSNTSILSKILNTSVKTANKYYNENRLYVLDKIDRLQVIQKEVIPLSKYQLNKTFYQRQPEKYIIEYNNYYQNLTNKLDTMKEDVYFTEIDNSLQLRENEDHIEMDKLATEMDKITDCQIVQLEYQNAIKQLELANIENANSLYIGNGLAVTKLEYETLEKNYDNDSFKEVDIETDLVKPTLPINPTEDEKLQYDLELQIYAAELEIIMLQIEQQMLLLEMETSGELK